MGAIPRYTAPSSGRATRRHRDRSRVSHILPVAGLALAILTTGLGPGAAAASPPGGFHIEELGADVCRDGACDPPCDDDPTRCTDLSRRFRVDYWGGDVCKGGACDPCTHVDCTPDPCEEINCDLDPCEEVNCDPDPCEEINCDPDPSCLKPQGCGYDDSENKICWIGDPGWIQDTDGDGTVDCLDADNDGDMLTDQFEDEELGYDRDNADHDGDGADDSLDIRPLDSAPQWTITAWDYDAPHEGDDCEAIGQGYPDPYIDQFILSLKHTVDYRLKIPTSWSEENHADDREPGDISGLTIDSEDGTTVTGGTYIIPNDIREFGTTELKEPPGISLRIGMMDHDEVTSDERMDLAKGDSVKADLGVDLDQSNQEPSSKGGDSCWGMVQFRVQDNVFAKWVCTALYHYHNEDQMIETGTDTGCENV